MNCCIYLLYHKSVDTWSSHSCTIRNQCYLRTQCCSVTMNNVLDLTIWPSCHDWFWKPYPLINFQVSRILHVYVLYFHPSDSIHYLMNIVHYLGCISCMYKNAEWMQECKNPFFLSNPKYLHQMNQIKFRYESKEREAYGKLQNEDN